ncbi:DUF1365 domain-containing protein [Oharaeibacter diazotrophicus]|uniref:DUF1365 family protein n=1 Tax=Oharaeibacter diazotrophicus TaxID=1920512 RepID=A0A4R6RL34_9HYPH|nr:DUF1365 domain-containing protein [Oharaeibacter diazotrophicus]TDP86815.1 hypothetical protein EDD54_0699 [Oharaeibacter diazotrophicus]BBE71242.1 hypothetical protein OHA_1_00812 [Pleomorphomonas sp. SM30]GLS77996.1 DUF1365 domain-containing protein [Oharaeibacter diazotrophicus]
MSVRIPTTVAANGAPPATAVTLYEGSVMHQRLKPLAHRFTYRIASLLVDLDRLAEADAASRLFSVGRFNLYGFDPRDHGPRDGGDVRTHVDGLLAEAGLARPARVLLLCQPRVLGFVFDPLSVYFAYDDAGALTALVYEVRNTFGEHHCYVAPVAAGESDAAGVRQSRRKRFFVSPFMDMEQRYDFRVLPPGEGLRVRILECDRDGPTLAATFAGRAVPLSSAALVRLFAAMPFHTLKVVAGIHWEAARLWLKGAPLFRRGPRPLPASYGDAAP